MVFEPAEQSVYCRKYLWAVTETIWCNGHVLNPRINTKVTSSSFILDTNLLSEKKQAVSVKRECEKQHTEDNLDMTQTSNISHWDSGVHYNSCKSTQLREIKLQEIVVFRKLNNSVYF